MNITKGGTIRPRQRVTMSVAAKYNRGLTSDFGRAAIQDCN